MVQSYHDESLELLKEYEQEWLQDFSYFQQMYSDHASKQKEDPPEDSHTFSMVDAEPISDMFSGGGSSDPPSFKSSAPSWAKKIFRKIAMLIHPDKTSNPEKDSRLFLKATNSFETGNYDDLLSIAIDLEITLDLDTPALGKMLQKKIDILRKDVSELERSIPWLWGESFGVYEVRVPLLKLNLSSQGIEVDEEDLHLALQEREQENDTR